MKKKLAKTYHGIGTPRFYSQWKTADGNLFHEIIGEVKRDKSVRKNVIANLKHLLRDDSYIDLIEFSIYEAEESEIEENSEMKRTPPINELIKDLLNILAFEDETLDEKCLEIANIISIGLSKATNQLDKIGYEEITKTSSLLQTFITVEKAEHPKKKLLKHFDDTRPDFLLFKNEERFLKGTYEIEDLKDPSGALNNLLCLAGVDNEELLNVISNQETGKRLKMMENANRKLYNEFTSSWSQSEVYPQFMLDLDSLKIQISYVDTYTEISERSDGLKQYIALKAFLAINNYNIPPVLLIDEAEIHLHYQAQSDLIAEFEKQNVLNSIFYSFSRMSS